MGVLLQLMAALGGWRAVVLSSAGLPHTIAETGSKVWRSAQYRMGREGLQLDFKKKKKSALEDQIDCEVALNGCAHFYSVFWSIFMIFYFSILIFGRGFWPWLFLLCFYIPLNVIQLECSPWVACIRGDFLIFFSWFQHEHPLLFHSCESL